MAAVAHGWQPDKVSVPVKVAKEFNRADVLKQSMQAKKLRKD